MTNSFRILYLLFLLNSCAEKHTSTSETPPLHNKKVIAYVHGWQNNWGNNDEKAKQITHINYAFANIKDGKIIEGNEIDTQVFQKLNLLKDVNKNLKILISVGGWSWSKNFSDAVLTEQSRQVFANSCIDFIKKHKIDGIDLDWEYPGQQGDNNVFRAEDKENFTAILKLLREKLDSVKPATYILTIATGANQSYLDHTNMREAHSYLDFINIMTYDFFTGGSSYTGHHANLYVSEFDEIKLRSAAKAVEEHVYAGIPVEKLVLGVPFYGRWWKGVNPTNNGLYQNATGSRGSLGYHAIADSLNSGAFQSHWDSAAVAPYIWRNRDSLFLTYENELSLKAKIEFIKSRRMNGIMFWQYNGDNGDLLNTIHKNLQKQ